MLRALVRCALHAVFGKIDPPDPRAGRRIYPAEGLSVARYHTIGWDACEGAKGYDIYRQAAALPDERCFCGKPATGADTCTSYREPGAKGVENRRPYCTEHGPKAGR